MIRINYMVYVGLGETILCGWMLSDGYGND